MNPSILQVSRFLAAAALWAAAILVTGSGGSLEAAPAAQEEHGARPAGEEGADQPFDIPTFVVHHLADSRTLDFAPVGELHLPVIHLGPLDLSITKHVVFLWIAAAIMLAIFIPMARARGPVHRGLYNFMEAFVVYVRDEVAVATIGKEKAGAYVPYLLTLFFFILFVNLLGLLPYGATATSNWMVTGSLAILTMLVAEGSSLVHTGIRGFLGQFLPVSLEAKGLAAKVGSLLMAALLVVVEIIVHLARILALTIRLAANMIAGHLLIFALIALIFFFRSYLIAPASIAASAAVYLLEIFIALVQAYIFTILTSLFIGMAVHEHH